MRRVVASSLPSRMNWTAAKLMSVVSRNQCMWSYTAGTTPQPWLVPCTAPLTTRSLTWRHSSTTFRQQSKRLNQSPSYWVVTLTYQGSVGRKDDYSHEHRIENRLNCWWTQWRNCTWTRLLTSRHVAQTPLTSSSLMSQALSTPCQVHLVSVIMTQSPWSTGSRHPSTRRLNCQVPLFHKANWSQLKENLHLFRDDYLGSKPRERSITTNWYLIKTTIHKLMTQHIPQKSVGTRFKLPYITPAIKRKIRRRHRVYKKAKKRGRKKDWEETQKLRKEINQELQQAYTNYINRLLDSEEDKPGAIKRFYRYIKHLRQESTGVSTLKAGGKISATAEEKANACNAQFQSAFSTEDQATMPQPHGERLPPMPDLNITENGVLKLLEGLNPSKASGPDQVPARVLKECAKPLAPVIADFYQQSIDEARLPDDWKQQYVHPVFKKGSRSDPANYRPVALTCILCKTLEHIIASNLHCHLEEHGFLSDAQHGFRKLRSCETQLYATLQDFFNTLEAGGRLDAVVLDFSKAFDKVPHERLMSKLLHCGVQGSTRRWIRHWLIGCEQRVVVDGTESDTCSVTSGVPQGSVLGPLLFLIFINDIAQDLNSNIRLFADDALLYRSIRSQEDHNRMQEDLDTLAHWASTWCMEFNVTKCYAMHIMTTSQKK